MAARQSSSAGKTQHKTRSRSPLKLYFLLITLTGVVGTLVSLGMLIFSVAKKIIITDQEYINAERYYEVEQCNNPIYKPVYYQETTTSTVPPIVTQTNTTRAELAPTKQVDTYVQPTEAEKEKCKAEKTTQLILSRSAMFKTDVLGGGIRSVLFIVLLFTHYFKFMRTRREEN